MRRACLDLAFFLLGAAALSAQPLATVPAPLAAQTSATLTVNPTSREEVRQFYRAIYNACENVPMGWTGSYTTGAMGDTTAAYKEAVRLRVNFFRALAGLPATVAFNPTYSAQDQSAALMMSANNTLQHTGIPSTWKFFTTAGANAAALSNLALGLAGPDAITGYIADNGSGNQVVGHRRWILYPQTREMGTGDVPGNGAYAPANALWILDGNYSAARPATRTTEVSYPVAGYMPYQLVWPRWSFSYPDADFSSASVTMKRGAGTVPTRIEPLSTGIGENTLVWVYNNLDSTFATPHPRPSADTIYTVSVNGVRIAGAPRNFSYNVTVFDPDVPGGDYATTTVNGTSAPAVGIPSTYTVTKPAFADSFQYRAVALSAFTKIYNAEAGLDGLIATTTAGYTTVETAVRSAGLAGYYLAHPNPRADQILLLPETFYIRDTTAAVTFASRLGYATSVQVARVQASTDDGGTWTDLYTQPGSDGPGEIAFVSRRASLSSLAGRTVRVRLNYSITQSGSAYPQADPTSGVGWFIDNLTLTGVQSVTTAAPTTVASGSTFAVTPTATGVMALQARARLFSSYFLEWGPLTTVNAVPSDTPVDPGRLINLSIRSNAGTAAQTLIVGLTLGGAGTSGAKPILVRAAGPALTALGVAGVLADPRLDVVRADTGVTIASNDNWATEPAVAAASAQVGAFPFTLTTSKDAALYRSDSTFAPGGYSIKIAGAGTTTGIALAEIYDATAAGAFTSATPRLTNLSARTQVGTGSAILIAGLTVGGTSDVKVLIRAIGPGLSQFGLTGVLADPKLEVFNSTGGRIAGNDNWDNTTLDESAAVGAFPLTAGSNDAVLVTSLQPGGYTVQITGVGNTTGLALIEVYEVP